MRTQNSSIGSHARGVAADILDAWMEDDVFPDRTLESIDQDRAYLMEVVYGIVRRLLGLDWMLNQLQSRKPDRKLRSVLIVGLYELFYMDTVPDYAAINVAVDLTKSRVSQKAAGFTNAILRKAQREKQQLIAALEEQSPAIRTSHPRRLFDRWNKTFGEQRTVHLCQWNNERADVTIRVNTLRASATDLATAAAEKDIHLRPHPRSRSDYFIVPRGVQVTQVPGYEDGWFTVQDPATELCVHLMAPSPDERILDACAAPGGKTALIAERMGGRGELVAMDPSRGRLARLEENMARLGLDAVEVVQGDATAERRWPDESFDAVLADVPCSNTGVIRRRPDARYRFSAEVLQDVTGTQRGILDALAPYVKPGGRLVYSTCSLEPEENERLIAQWLTDHPDFLLNREETHFPPESRTDGAYAALLVKKEAG